MVVHIGGVVGDVRNNNCSSFGVLVHGLNRGCNRSWIVIRGSRIVVEVTGLTNSLMDCDITTRIFSGFGVPLLAGCSIAAHIFARVQVPILGAEDVAAMVLNRLYVRPTGNLVRHVLASVVIGRWIPISNGSAAVHKATVRLLQVNGCTVFIVMICLRIALVGRAIPFVVVERRVSLPACNPSTWC